MRIPKKGSSEKWHVCHHFLKNNYSSRSGDFFWGVRLKKTSSVGCFEGHYPPKKNLQLKKGWLLEFARFLSPQGNKKTPGPPKKNTTSPPSNPTVFFWPLEAGETPWQLAESEGLHRRWKGEGWRVVRNQRLLLSLKRTASFHLQNGELEDISLKLARPILRWPFQFYLSFFCWRSKI